MKFFTFALIGIFLLSVVEIAIAQEPQNFGETLTGNWNGERDRLQDMGVNIEITNYFDFFASSKGSTILNNLNANAYFDGKKLWGLKGSSALISVLQTNGSEPNRRLTGAAQRIDDMETNRRGFEPYQAWVQQEFLGGGISALAGLYDASNEFYSTDFSDVLINNAYGFGTELAATGKKGIAIFPTSALGGRLAVHPNENYYIEGAILDGINSAPESRQTIRQALSGSALLIAEAGYIKIQDKKEQEKFGIGVWSYTDQIKSFVRRDNDETPAYNSNGIYALAEGYLYREKDEPNHGLRAFIRAGNADRESDRFEYSLSGGLSYPGIFPARERGELAIAASTAVLSPVYRQSLKDQGIPNNSAETALELTYKDYPLPWLAVQPDIQYIVNPDGIKSQDNSAIFGVRVEINF